MGRPPSAAPIMTPCRRWSMYNAAYAEFIQSADGYHLLSFNAAPI